jgi:hypothetical protein
LLKGGGIKDEEVPYFEFVWNQRYSPYIVQARSGPALPASKDYVPADVTVERVRVLSADEDEMAWEQEAKQLGHEPGVVVYHPGGGMTSHFGVHCGINNVPYITTYRPTVGQRIEQCVEDEPIALEALRDGIQNGLGSLPGRLPVEGRAEHYANDTLYGYDYHTWKPALKLALFALHNYNGDHGETGAWFIGAGAGWLWRGLAAACLGEYRHWSHRQPHMRVWCPDRETIFNWMFHLTPEQIIEPLQIATDEFLRGTHWASNVGGLAWGRCALSALRLYTAMSDMVLNPTEENAKQFLAAFNTCVHMAHNGGWVFNKFIDVSIMNQAALVARPFLIRSIVPAMIAAQSVRIVSPQPVGASSMGIPWGVDPEMVAYADDPDSIKRADHKSGSKKIKYQEECAVAFGKWLRKYGTWLNYRELLESLPVVERCILTADGTNGYYNLHMTFKDHPGIEPGIKTWGGMYMSSAIQRLQSTKPQWHCSKGTTFFEEDIVSTFVVEVKVADMVWDMDYPVPRLRFRIDLFDGYGLRLHRITMRFPISWVAHGEIDATEEVDI